MCLLERKCSVCCWRSQGLSCVQHRDGRKGLQCSCQCLCQTCCGGTRVGNSWEPETVPENCFIRRAICFCHSWGLLCSELWNGNIEAFWPVSCVERLSKLYLQYNRNLWSCSSPPSVSASCCSSVFSSALLHSSAFTLLLWLCKGVIPGISNRLIPNLQYVLFPKRQRSPAGDRTCLKHVSLHSCSRSNNITALWQKVKIGAGESILGLSHTCPFPS